MWSKHLWQHQNWRKTSLKRALWTYEWNLHDQIEAFLPGQGGCWWRFATIWRLDWSHHLWVLLCRHGPDTYYRWSGRLLLAWCWAERAHLGGIGGWRVEEFRKSWDHNLPLDDALSLLELAVTRLNHQHLRPRFAFAQASILSFGWDRVTPSCSKNLDHLLQQPRCSAAFRLLAWPGHMSHHLQRAAGPSYLSQ